MSYNDRLLLSPSWSFPTQSRGADPLAYTIGHGGFGPPDVPRELPADFTSLYGSLGDNNVVCLTCGRVGHTPAHCHASPISPTGSAFTTTSAPDPYRIYSPTSPIFVGSYPEGRYTSEASRNSRSHSFPPSRSPPQASHTSPPDFEGATRHDTFERNTGEEHLFNNFIHRLTDEEKRCFAPTHRPTFLCLYEKCGRYIMHRAQVKPHLVEQHGIRFRKPFGCSCGAEFGRAVEATRHVEDKKACEVCGRSGRKSKGSSICLRCLRPYGIGH